MLRVLFTTVLILGAGTLLQAPIAAPAGFTGDATGHAIAAPQSRREGRQAIDDATAASLIGAISSQLGQHRVTVHLGRVDVAPAGLEQREIHGSGQLRIDDDSQWIPFRFNALYDTYAATTQAPEVMLGEERPARLLARNAALAGRLDQALERRLQAEFTQQRVGIVLDAVRSTPAGGHYLAVQAQGRTDFGSDGQAATQVQALYDTRSGRWLQLDYRLGGASPMDAPRETVALR